MLLDRQSLSYFSDQSCFPQVGFCAGLQVAEVSFQLTDLGRGTGAETIKGRYNFVD